MISTRLLSLFLVIASVAVTGCGNRLKADLSPAYQGKGVQVSQLGITGGGTSAAIPAFQKAGYKVIDLGAGESPVERAAAKGIPFVAAIDPVGTDGAWWDGFFDFAMRVTETKDHQVVWSATAEYGQGGLFINQTKSTDEAMRAMVADFAKTFPPAPNSATTQGGSPASTQSGPLKPITVN
jgi:hypothetical protein